MLGSVSREAGIAELRQVVDGLMQVIDTAHAPIFGTDSNGHITEWNRTAADISGWTESETLGKSYGECFIPEKHQPSVSEVLAGALSGRKRMKFGFPLFTKDGKRREMLMNVAARKGPDGSPIAGIGTAQENLKRMFQPFDQEDQSEARAYDGLGLGLAICYEVAVKHGGSVNVERAQGEGSSFIITLPYKMADLAEGKEDLIKDMDVLEPVIQAKSPRTGSKGELPKPTLCVDSDASSFGRDNSLPPTDASGRVEAIEPVSPGTMDAMVGFEQDCCHTEWSGPEGHLGGHADELVTILTCDVDGVNQGVTEATLSHCNFKVVACKNGVQCLKYIDECTTLPDVVLLDLMIGGLSGLDVLREIRRTYACTTLPIIMVSAENSTTAVTTGFRLACNDWLHKPFDRQELIARVRCQVLIKRHFKALEDTSVPCSVLEKLLPQHLAERLAGHGNLTDTELAAVKAEILQDMVPKAFDSTGPQGALASEDEAQRYKSCFAAAQKESARLQEQLTSLLTQEKKAVEEQKKASREQKELQQKYAMLQIELGHVREKYDAQCKETAQESSSVCDAIQPLPTGPSTDASLMALQLQHAHLQIELKARDRRLVHAQQLVKRLRAQGATHERRCGELAGELRQLKTPVAFPQFPGMSG